jgi:hypothetical protein
MGDKDALQWTGCIGPGRTLDKVADVHLRWSLSDLLDIRLKQLSDEDRPLIIFSPPAYSSEQSIQLAFDHCNP